MHICEVSIICFLLRSIYNLPLQFCFPLRRLCALSWCHKVILTWLDLAVFGWRRIHSSSFTKRFSVLCLHSRIWGNVFRLFFLNNKKKPLWMGITYCPAQDATNFRPVKFKASVNKWPFSLVKPRLCNHLWSNL
jgi:hypothetical protein